MAAVINTDPFLSATPRSDANNLGGELSASRSGLISTEEDIKLPYKYIFLDGSFWTAVLTIVNAALGAGLLSVPFAFASSGFLTGAFAAVLLIGMSFLSLCIIMAYMMRAQAQDPQIVTFGALIGWGVGPRAAIFVDVLVFINGFGACIGYLVVLGDVFTPLAMPIFNQGHGAASHLKPLARTIVVGVGSIFCLLLCLLRRISALKYTAAVAVFACCFTLVVLVVQALEHPCKLGDCDDEVGRHGWCTASQYSNATFQCNPQVGPGVGLSAWPASVSALLGALPVFVFAMQCHIQCAFIFAEMPSRLRLPSPRIKVAGCAMALLFLFYWVVGSAGFLRFGAQTQGDCLENFSVKDAPANVARVAVGITALSAFPMQHFPARAVMHRVWCAMGCGRGGSTRISPLFVMNEALLCKQHILRPLSHAY